MKPVGSRKVPRMSSEFLNSNHSAWNSFASSARNSEANEADYPVYLGILNSNGVVIVSTNQFPRWPLY